MLAQISGMIINFGSINIDHVYKVEHFPDSGETIFAASHQRFLGGKGINQSIAISKAGGSLIHVGSVGADGDWAISEIRSLVSILLTSRVVDMPTGHAIICVDEKGENQIIVLSGANRALKQQQLDNVLTKSSGEVGWVLLQNETNLATEIVTVAKSNGVKIAYAAAPFVADVTVALIDRIDLLAVNEGEAEELSAALGVKPHQIPVPQLLITKGSKGAEFHSDGKVYNCPRLRCAL